MSRTKIKQLQRYTENISTDGIQLEYTVQHNLGVTSDELIVQLRDNNSNDILIGDLKKAVDETNAFIIATDVPIKAGVVTIIVR